MNGRGFCTWYTGPWNCVIHTFYACKSQNRKWQPCFIMILAILKLCSRLLMITSDCIHDHWWPICRHHLSIDHYVLKLSPRNERFPIRGWREYWILNVQYGQCSLPEIFRCLIKPKRKSQRTHLLFVISFSKTNLQFLAKNVTNKEYYFISSHPSYVIK